MLADKILNTFSLEKTTPPIVLIVGDIYDQASNFKGQVVAQGGESRKFTCWLKHCMMSKQQLHLLDII